MTILAMIVAATVAVYSYRAQVEAAPANVPDVECYPWATTADWTITRCQDWNNGESCLIASSGFVACRFD